MRVKSQQVALLFSKNAAEGVGGGWVCACVRVCVCPCVPEHTRVLGESFPLYPPPLS